MDTLRGIIPLITVLFILAGTSMAGAQTVYTATTVSSTGAVGTNAAFEAGVYPYWYPELQKVGADYIEAGIAQERPDLINKGLLILDWGWSKQAPDGSFPGCGSNPITATNALSATGGVFHTTSLFLEAAVRSVRDLQAYSPFTYSLDPSTYAAKIQTYESNLALGAAWLTNTNWTPGTGGAAVSVPQLGFNFDQTYSHRYYLLASTLQQISVVTNNPALVTETYGANWWIDQAFPRQLGPGWQAALLTTSITSNAPAQLLAPGIAAPPNTVSLLSAVGVNPERNGYDVSYHMVGCLHASRWYNASTDSIRKAQVATMLTSALQWERSRQVCSTPPAAGLAAGLAFGDIDSTGSTRVGVDLTQNGQGIKSIATSEVQEAFDEGGRIDGKGRDLLGGIRYQNAGVLPSADSVSATGAIGTNAAFDANPAKGYNIGSQKDCADWIAFGILNENDAQIRKGLLILNWGLARQAQDGSFPQTSSPYTDTAYFIEAASRCVLMLEGYQPISHPLDTTMLSGIPATTSAITSAATWLLTPKQISNAGTWSASRQFLYAVALGEAAVVTENASGAQTSAYQAQSASFLSKALSMQLIDGTNPENGVFAGNAQAIGITMAERLYLNGSLDALTKTQVSASIDAALTRLTQVVNIDGSFTYASPATVTIQNAFAVGAGITGKPGYQVYFERISSSFD